MTFKIYKANNVIITNLACKARRLYDVVRFAQDASQTHRIQCDHNNQVVISYPCPGQS
jgi:hypothetical protein